MLLIAIDCLPHQVTAKRGFSSDADLRRPLPCPSAPTATGAATAAVAVTTTAAATAAAAVEAKTTGEAAALTASYASLHSSLPAAMREPELKSANDAVCNGAASCGGGRGHGDHGNGNGGDGGDGGCCRTGGVDGGGPLASLVPPKGSPLVQGRWPKGSPTAKAPAQAEGEEEARDSSQEDVAFHQLALSVEAFALIAGLYRRISRAAAGGNVGGVMGGWVAAWEQLGLVLVPAAWLCVNMVPLMMVLAYARLPDSLPLSTL